MSSAQTDRADREQTRQRTPADLILIDRFCHIYTSIYTDSSERGEAVSQKYTSINSIYSPWTIKCGKGKRDRRAFDNLFIPHYTVAPLAMSISRLVPPISKLVEANIRDQKLVRAYYL
jgi:hypothetical protein